MAREKVTLFGASGTMGWRAFQELWRRRGHYDMILLLRPSQKNKRLFARYEREAGITPSAGPGVVEAGGLKIVWGDARRYEDVAQAIRGTDWVLDAMALISPQADYYPEMAWAVNAEATRSIVRAIEAEPGGAGHIRLVYTGSVAETGDRLGSIHWGRVGDPLKPPVFDYYAVTKVAGERAVLESSIRHWASLRMTFIMPTDYHDCMSLLDPIMFHLPLSSFMENITDRDAGLGLVNCLDIPGDSDFWRRAYNMGGGPAMRCTAYEFLARNMRRMGLAGLEACTERRWFALRNFHMQYYEDSGVLNGYLHHWRDSLADFWQALDRDTPAGLRLLAALCPRLPPVRRLAERATHRLLQGMAERHRNGTAHWYKARNDGRISAFYRDYQTYEAIPGWDAGRLALDPESSMTRRSCATVHDVPGRHEQPEWHRLDHGYDEARAHLDLADLQGAARFRGGECLWGEWEGDLYRTLQWRCARGHEFAAKPYTILKAGHWCPACVPPPWDYDEEARRNPFFAQAWYPNHGHDEHNCYPADCMQDIAEADRD